ncbi:unnamed protein product, partial [Caretta caretta]
MADLEQRFLSSHPLTPLLYLHYIDDIFIIWTHGKEALEEFHHDFNNFHPTINLSLVHSTQEIHFLDTTVLINDGHINTTLYRKPTDRCAYLHASSFHPDHTTRSIVYSQALRYNRICSNPSDRDKHLQDLYQAFLQLQYPPAEVKKQIDRARRVPRSHLLQDRPNKENNRKPLAVTFSPQLKPLQRIIKDLQPILKDDPTLSQILGDRPVLAYRQPPNLKQILTSNHIPYNRTTNPGTYPCNKARCQLCPHIYSGDTIIGPNHISHTIRGSFTCTSTNVIYAIMCQQCPSAMYIGQTGQSLRKRINGHKSDVKNYNIHKPVGEHFNLFGHVITDMKVAILQQKNFKSRLQRETVELEFICKLDTINLGLNRDWEWLSHYASFADGGRLLVVPMDGSHWLSMRAVLDELRHKGHEIVIVAPEINLYVKTSENYVMKTYPVPFTKAELEGHFLAFTQEVFEERPLLERFVRLRERLKNTSGLILSTCTHLVYNKELIQYLEESKFDAVFTDAMMPCGQIVAEYLSIPSVFFLRGIPCGLDYKAIQCPNPPSYVPRLLTTNTDHMTFPQRVKNMLFSLLEIVLCDFVYGPYAKLASEFLQREITVTELLSHGSVWLMRFDFVMDYPRPLMPNIVIIGGINCVQKELSQRHFLYNKELIKYLEDSKFDAVLMDPVLPCGPIIAEYLSVPSVYFMRGLPCGLDFKATQCPNPISYVPRIFTSNSDHMTFTQRVKNLLVNAAENLLCYLFYSQYESLASEFLQREVTILELFSKASIWLLRYDFVFEYPRPVMPNMVFIGGTNCEQKKPLSK